MAQLKLEIVAAYPSDVLEVLRRLRSADLDELFATCGAVDPSEFARAAVQGAGGLAWAALVDEVPEAVFGVTPMTPFVASVWGFGTDRFRRVVPTITRFFHQEVWPAAIARGFHRAEARSIASHHEAHAWLPKIGMHFESVAPGFGAGGEDFQLFVWRGNS